MRLFADTADIAAIRRLAEAGLIDGVTTNTSLIAKSGAHISRRLASFGQPCLQGGAGGRGNHVEVTAVAVLGAEIPGTLEGQPGVGGGGQVRRPPSNQGTCWARALSTCPEAMRPAMPLASAGKVGIACSQPSGRRRACIWFSSWARSRSGPGSAVPAPDGNAPPPHRGRETSRPPASHRSAW